ncbi:HlyD family efflux transporter periplasmic adaptor subunit [Scytonema sp. UIC 10036]|uniref:HlyD family efflux transporter periplasmic adaptor subunit n=1 Tax=Scytonema sp. UIC 10036 TaxID=2304196 RepID=UPI0012DA3555|nr:HlyD family efflux transporter periplasmic adaptor subunit [Scytonema sp. UIC 10036]MUH01018.1 HlyD family efflux transporter periplasmic adaptor subunit [Scytonema sp. UIC 10036]
MVQPRCKHSQSVSFGTQQCITYIALLSCLGLCTACGTLKAQDNTAQETPTTSPNVTNRVVALGKLIPEGDVIKISVANAQDSRVNQIFVNEGDFVKANQVIATLQGRDRAEQQLRDAQANVTVKRSQLLKIQQGDFKQGEIVAQRATIAELEARIRTETKQKEAAIAQVEATLRNAKLKYERNLALSNEGAISKSDYDNAREEFDKAQATLLQSKAELENTTTTLQAQLEKEQANLKKLQEVRPVDVEIAKAELEQALIQVEQRKAELDNTLVRVPIAGQILRINTRVGEQVNTQEGIAELGKTNQMYAIAEVYETDIAKVRLGHQATITSEYGGFQGELKGKVDGIGLQIGKTRLNQDQTNPTTDVNARVVEVKIRLNREDSPKVAALTGMQVRVKIDTK